jgi:hypothetical protein
MTVNGIDYSTDLIIFPNGRVIDGWRRGRGHRIKIEDLTDLLSSRPELIIAGTGMNGMAKPDKGLKEELLRRGIEFIALDNKEAVKKYNELGPIRRTGACFHLTC